MSSDTSNIDSREGGDDVCHLGPIGVGNMSMDCVM